MDQPLSAGLNGEDGHIPQGLAALVAAVGVIALGIGAANDTGWLSVVGGIAGGLGIVAYAVVRHRTIDWELFRRTDSRG